MPAGAATVHISGQIGVDGSGRRGATVQEQTGIAFENIATLLASVGAGPHSLVKLSTFVVGEESFPAFAAARNRIFAEWFPDGDYPAHSAAVVNGLALPGLLVEIEGIAVLDG